MGYSNLQNILEPEDLLFPALVQEYFQQSPPKKPLPTNKVFMTKIWRKDHPPLGNIIFHILLYCYATVCCGSHWQRQNPTQYQFSTWNLLMNVASRNISRYLGSLNWRIVLAVCYNKKPQPRHSVGRSFDILPGTDIVNRLQ